MRFPESEKRRLNKKYGSWAVVTGASSGIGRELAERLAEAGLNLLLTARREVALKEIAGQLSSRHGVQTQIIPTDLSTTKGVESVISASETLDVGLLIAAAGYGTSGRFIDASLEKELNMLQVNCAAITALTHHFSRKFAEQGRGGVILLGSLVGFQGTPYAAHYAATKAYVQSLAEALGVEMRPFGVDILSAAPGPVTSGFADRASLRMGRALKPSDIGIPILKALGRRQTVLPGFLTKLLVGSLRLLPRQGKVRVMSLVMGGMTAHQRR